MTAAGFAALPDQLLTAATLCQELLFGLLVEHVELDHTDDAATFLCTVNRRPSSSRSLRQNMRNCA